MQVRVHGEWKWLWNMMDEKTGFQLVSMVAETRLSVDAKRLFKQSKKVGGKKPKVVVTDGLQSYKSAFRSEFYDHHQSVKHVADVALESGMNNIIERMHGSIREREKVMRGLKAKDTPIVPMNQIYYNFIRPHSALNGKTPADEAGIGFGDGKKWFNLINESIKFKNK